MQNITQRQTIEYLIVSVCAIASIVLLYFNMPRKGDVVLIDCRMSEISPDFTTEMRQACRQANRQNNENKKSN